MTDPTTATNPPNPQDLIDQALGDMGAATPTPVEPTPTPTPTEPTALPPLEPLAPTEVAADTAVASSEPVVAETPKSEDVMPAELTESVEQSPEPMPESGSETINNLDSIEAKGEDVPLALVGAQPPEASPIASAPVVEPVNPVVPPALTGMMSDEPKQKKGKGNLLKNLVVAMFVFIGLVGGIGVYGYQKYGSVEGLIAAVFEPKFIRVDGEVVRNPAYDPNDVVNEAARDEYFGVETVPDAGQKGTDEASCNGCLNGGWMVWRDGECKITGICNSGVPGKDTENPAIEESNDADSCFRSGGTWCGNVVDTSGVSHAFCGPSNGEACYQLAIDRGITMQIGRVGCECIGKDTDGKCTLWSIDNATLNAINGAQTSQETKDFEISRVSAQCQNQGGAFTSTGGTEMWICPKGTTVACTANVQGAKRFYGNPANGFCGVIQVDTGAGHTSYSSTETCEEEENNTPNPSTPPTITTNPTLMCDSITRAPNTTVSLGDTLTFTCVGSSSPAGSVNLSYKFRYSVNSGAYTVLANKTATTAEMTVAACGSYKVQCQACGTINGTLVCDPVWSGATTQ